eukprot:scaffold17538_cov62-Phaeocystis_antarctica.AAC.1
MSPCHALVRERLTPSPHTVSERLPYRTRTAGKSELAARARCPRRSAFQPCAAVQARGARSKALRRCYLGRCDGAARSRGGWLHIECVGLWRVPTFSSSRTGASQCDSEAV